MTYSFLQWRQRRREGQRCKWLDFNAGVERLRAKAHLNRDEETQIRQCI